MNSKIIKNCRVCGTEFAVTAFFASGPREAKYCSPACSAVAARRQKERTCQQCGTPFQQKASAKNPGLFCSHTCLHAHRRDVLPSQEIAELYQAGLSTFEIAERFGTSGTAIQHRLELAGIPRRDAATRNTGTGNPMSGRAHTADSRDKIRAANVKQFSDPEARRRHAELTAQQIADGRTGKTNSSLEQRFATILSGAGIAYQQGYRLARFAYDFYLPGTNTLIECDGTFWHADPRRYPDRDNLSRIQRYNVANDLRKDALAAEKGFRLLRFWEQDIEQEPTAVLDRLNQAIHL